MVENPVSELALITNSFSALHMVPSETLDPRRAEAILEAISAATQEALSVERTHFTLTPYPIQSRPAAGGPEPMDLCYVEIENPRTWT